MQLRRPSNSFLASIAVHVIVIAFFVQALVMRRPLFDFFSLGRTTPEQAAEHISYVTLPPTGHSSEPGAPRAGGNGRPEHAHQAPIVAPRVIPTTIPPVPRNDAGTTDEDPGTGPLIGGGGRLRGVQPRYHDPRLWGGPGDVSSMPRTSAQQLDSVIAGDIGAYNDSMRVAAQNQRDPTDWTVKKNGQKYGIDQRYIHLGPISLPTAILAMLPLNVTGNPTVLQRERAYSAMHDDIMEHAQSAMNEADFQKAVRAIRLRKDRERREREQQKAAAVDPRKNTSAPTTVAGPSDAP